MDSMQSEFIRILRDYLHGERAGYTITPQLLEYAATQETEGIFYLQTGDQSLYKSFAYAAYIYRMRTEAVQDLSGKLKNIPHFYVKGLQLSAWYPDPPLRTMGDMDLIIRPEDRAQVMDILSGAGFRIIHEFSSETTVMRDRLEIEVHTSLIHSSIGDKAAGDFFSDCWEHVTDHRLDPDYHFLFILQHLKGHMLSEGVGFRHFMDVALAARDPALDWDRITEGLAALKLLKFAKTVFAFNQYLFDMPAPIPAAAPDEDFCRMAADNIFEGGVFGHEAGSNHEAQIAAQAIADGSDPEKARRKYFIRLIFPDYAKMCRQSYCTYVRKTALLLPVAWIHRILYNAVKPGQGKAFVRQTTWNQEKEDRLEMFKKWGL